MRLRCIDNDTVWAHNPDMVSLDAVLDILAKKQYGRTLSEAHEQFICVRDGETMQGRLNGRADWREYAQSGLCLHCVDEIFDVGEEDCAND